MSTRPSIIPRRNMDRGAANHGWLDTKHTFSFAFYHDDNHSGFGPLRVLNEDVVQPSEGFGTHGHREYEIFSYIVSGELEHKDSLGHVEILPRGAVQHTSTGTGIRHSEWNRNTTTPVHFLQIWAQPDRRGLSPSYATSHFTDEEKRNALRRVVAHHLLVGKDEKTVKTNATLQVFATLLDPGKAVTHTEPAFGKRYYVHTVQTGGPVSLQVSNGEETSTEVLLPGDGAYINEVTPATSITLTGAGSGTQVAEVLLFDLA